MAAFRSWLYRFRREALEPAADVEARFVEVTADVHATAVGGSVVVELPGGVRICGTDWPAPGYVAEVVRALRWGSC